MELVNPSIKYKTSYLQALKEYQAEGRHMEYDPKLLEKDFQSFVNMLIGFSEGKNLPAGYVPSTKYWLVDNGEFIGNVSIRHVLNDTLLKFGGHIGYDIRPSKRRMGYGKNILKLALPKAKELELGKVLITCDETNIGSRKIIETNGGILENELLIEEGKPKKRRYWITLT